MEKTIIPAIADEAREWPLDKLTRYILEHYHKGTVDQVEVICTMAKQFLGKPGTTDMHVIVQLLSESYEDLSNHFHKEEMMLFPYIIELQKTINQGLEAQPFHCGSVQLPCRQMMMEHDGELERYDRILGICKTFTEPFASSEECRQLVSCIEVFLQKLKEHIYLENENLFPRAIKMEGLEIMA
ncbi:MAG: hemerythrin domain-containing protein [Prevotella sp.]|nr:hemerythrin domain-containing protein [Prevotella sp.]